MGSWGRRFGGLSLSALLMVACATPRGSPGALSDLRPGERPAPGSDEGGLWMVMDRLENDLRTSGGIVHDPALNAYLREAVCRLATEHCPNIRVYLVRTPYFNASMAPNGVMQVWTGLLLRAENEAQMAYVLGHELGHYLRRHAIQRWRDVRSKSDFVAFFGLLTAGAGVGFVGLAAQLVALGTVFAFSRDNEREADDIGFELMVRAGYDPREAAKIWRALIAERDAAEDSEPFIFFATHPPTAERAEILEDLGRKAVEAGGAGDLGRERFLNAVLPHRGGWLRNELRRRDFKRTTVLLDRLQVAGANVGEIRFFQGELYRLRAEEGDAARAEEAYQAALDLPGVPAEAYRSLGLMALRRGDRAGAREALGRYLEVRPDAQDAEMVRNRLRELE